MAALKIANFTKLLGVSKSSDDSTEKCCEVPQM